MKHMIILVTLFLFACGASTPTSEATPQLAKKEMSDEEIINSLLGAEVSTDPYETNAAEESEETDTGPAEMVFE